MKESMVQYLDAKVYGEESGGCTKMKKTRTDCEREAERTRKEDGKSILIRGQTRVFKYMAATIGASYMIGEGNASEHEGKLWKQNDE